MKVIKNCQRCNSPFSCYPSQLHLRKNCSLKCSNSNIKKNTGRTHFKKGSTPWNKGKEGSTRLLSRIRFLNQYKIWRANVFLRDNYACQYCGDRTIAGHKIKIECHHIKPFIQIVKESNINSIKEAEECQELWNLANGITLCYDCHQKTKYFKFMKGGKSEMIRQI